jgi:hypothetical protein
MGQQARNAARGFPRLRVFASVDGNYFQDRAAIDRDGSGAFCAK